MALTLNRCADHIRLALGREPSSRTSINEIVNAAGQWLVGVVEWSWLERPAASLNFAAGVTYVVLPDDFGRIVKLFAPDLTSEVRMVTLGELARMRQYSPWSGLVTHAALVYAPGNTSGPPTVRLEIAPTPGSNETAALSLFYRAKWTVLDADSEHVQVPDFMEPLMLSAVRAYACGWERKEGRSLTDYLDEVMASREMDAAISLDSQMQSDFGEAASGAIADQYSVNATRRISSPWNVAGPT